MRTIVSASRRALASPHDYEARANLMWAGTLAHNNVCGAGRVQDWASHGIEHELSALYGCAHGAGLAVVMPAWMEYVMKADIARVAQFAAKVFGVPEGDHAAMAKEGIVRYRAWLREIGMPLVFDEIGPSERTFRRSSPSLDSTETRSARSCDLLMRTSSTSWRPVAVQPSQPSPH